MALKSLLLAALALMLGADAMAGQDSGKKKSRDPARLKEMPSDEDLAKRRAESEALPLFKSHDPLAFTLIANFRALSRDRDTLSTKRFAARLVVAGTTDTIPMRLRTRGHYRLAKCSFVPLRMEFTKKTVDGSPFENEKSLKLGTHCQKDDLYEQYVLREYLVYRIQQLVSPIAFRVRLARVTYVDSASMNSQGTYWGLIVESEEHMAARFGGIVRELRRATFDDVEQVPLLGMSLFEYMIGNTDWSLYALHNVRVISTPSGEILPVPYDFDFSGLVDARYATPDPKLPIRNVRQRLFRGPCKAVEEWAPVVARFVGKKAEVMALYDSLPGLDKGYAQDAKEYLADFYRTIERPGDMRAEIVENCNRKGGT
ncbi:MAG: hypothetical protein MNPFHGCM_02412 [Gemmatimonadaceae bacterium]|nr:hypothetical protein [Gemmatimonadaceae bacterium]